MASIMQGTTPIVTIKIYQKDFLLSDVTRMKLTIKNTNLESHTLDDVTIDTDTNSFTYRFTEDETAALDPKLPVIIQGQCWLNNGDTVEINKLFFNVVDMQGVGSDG